jgi:hypothetical protein
VLVGDSSHPGYDGMSFGNVIDDSEVVSASIFRV